MWLLNQKKGQPCLFLSQLPIVILGSNQVGPSKGKEIPHQTHFHSGESKDTVDQEEQPASLVTSSSFEHQNVESSCSSDRKDLSSDFHVPSTSSSSDSSTEDDADNSDSTKTAKEPVDKS